MVGNHLPSLLLAFLLGRCGALFSLLQSLRVGVPFKVHIVRGCVGSEVLIDVLAHIFDQGVGFSLASCVRGRVLRLEMLSHSVYGHLLFQLRMRPWSNGEEACYVDVGGYLEEGFRGGTLRPPSFAWWWP